MNNQKKFKRDITVIVPIEHLQAIGGYNTPVIYQGSKRFEHLAIEAFEKTRLYAEYTTEEDTFKTNVTGSQTSYELINVEYKDAGIVEENYGTTIIIPKDQKVAIIYTFKYTYSE